MKDIEKMTIQDSFLLLKSKIEKLSEKRIIALNKEIEKLNHKNNFLKKQVVNQKENIKALRCKYQKEIKKHILNNEKCEMYYNKQILKLQKENEDLILEYREKLENYIINNEKTNIYLKDKNNKEG